MTWGAYILQSSSTGHLYTGATNDPQRRVREHNTGKGAKRTRWGVPWSLIYWEPCESKSEAHRREYEIKQLTRIQKFKLVSKYRSQSSSSVKDMARSKPLISSSEGSLNSEESRTETGPSAT